MTDYQPPVTDGNPIETNAAEPPQPDPLRSVYTSSFGEILKQTGVSLVVSTYQAGKVILVRYDPETKTTELQVLEPVVEADVLLLDDLGAWKMTDWMNDTLFYILNSRYMAKRPTLITTNYQDVTREEAVAADPLRRREFLVERIGQRLRSRLMEMCLVVRLHGSDHRQARQQANQVALRR